MFLYTSGSINGLRTKGYANRLALYLMVYARAFKKERVCTKAFKKKGIYIGVSGRVVNFEGSIRSFNIIILESSISYTDGSPPSDERRGRLAVENLRGVALIMLRIFSWI